MTGNLLIMRKWRRKYYDIFAKFYDWVIRVHSGDVSERLREFLVEKASIKDGMRVIDLCTGTGSVAVKVKTLCPKACVYGIDFSKGMLKKAMKKSKDINWILATAAFLPIKDQSIDVILCSHAFYELKGAERFWALGEIKRVLKPGGKFLLMEHEIPKSRLIRVLYYIRIFSMGFYDGIGFIKRELDVLKLFFRKVEKLTSPTGRSKLILGVK